MLIAQHVSNATTTCCCRDYRKKCRLLRLPPRINRRFPSVPGHANVVEGLTWGVNNGVKSSNNKPSLNVPSQLTSKKLEMYRFEPKSVTSQGVRNAA